MLAAHLHENSRVKLDECAGGTLKDPEFPILHIDFDRVGTAKLSPKMQLSRVTEGTTIFATFESVP